MKILLFITIFLTFTLPSYADCAGERSMLRRPFFWGAAVDGYPVTDEVLSKLETETGIQPQILVFFLQWPSEPGEGRFPLESLEAAWRFGAVSCITWEPMYYRDGEEIMVDLERILSGEYDEYIAAFADGVKEWKKPVLIRFAHEMNLERYHWGGTIDDYGPESPVRYRKMFRYLVDAFREAGADNALWVFCPNAESVPNISFDPAASWNELEAYYPGDAYVDILGVDGYNWGTARTLAEHGWQSHWRSFRDVFEDAYNRLRTLAPKKPILVFETACAGQGGDKISWIAEAVQTAVDWELMGLVWFQADKEVDWRINSTGDYSYVPVIRSAASCSQKTFEALMGTARGS